MPARTSSVTARTFAALALPLVAFFMWACAWLTDQKIYLKQPLSWLPLYPTRLVLIALSAGLLVVAFVVGVLRSSRAKWWKRTCAVGLAGALTTLCLETVFMFVPRSHNVGYTLAAHLWHRLFWKPVNSLGYRDGEHTRVAGKRLVFALGDSFTAGDGLTSTSQRFSDLVAEGRPDLQVMNLGVNGADTRDEWRNLQAHPLRPDVLVLEYYPNDIEGAMKAAGKSIDAFTPYDDIPFVHARLWVRASYVANFVYWQFQHADLLGYSKSLEQGFRDEAVFAAHLQDLERFCSYAKERGIPFFVVVFPLMNDLEYCRDRIVRVEEVFTTHGARVLDVAALVRDLDVDARTVNRQNAHASAAVNQRVADELVRLLPPGLPH